jgi:hypothetical protein
MDDTWSITCRLRLDAEAAPAAEAAFGAAVASAVPGEIITGALNAAHVAERNKPPSF